MRILVVGSGGREHALVWKLSQEAEVVCAPGNPGIAEECVCEPVPSSDTEAILGLCRRIEPDLVVVGPEAPLIGGLGDALRAKGLHVVGPNRDGARLEGSKAFSKEAMAAAGVPTAAHATFGDPVEARAFARRRFGEGARVVVKASGEALGKGVTVCGSPEDADEAIERMMVRREFGAAGDTVVVEDRLEGLEFSLMTLCSDGAIHSLPIAQDYKRAHDGDLGANTGGMGTFSPVPWIDAAMVATTEERVVLPLLRHLAAEGVAFRGVLFSGLMLCGEDPFCLEYNVRFGDPETQTVMMRLGSGLAEALHAVSRGLPIPPPQVVGQAAVTVVVASESYPEAVPKGRAIGLPQAPPGTKIFHAGTRVEGERLVTSGGRGVGASALGNDLSQARERAYALARQVVFEGAWMRGDIALLGGSG